MLFRLLLRKRLLLVLPILLFSYSCEMLTDELLECNDKIVPKLPRKNMLIGKVGSSYSEIISAYIQNADEETFEYEFSMTGNLPAGLGYRSDGRVFEIFGKPTEAGTYTFKIKVKLPHVISGVGDGFCFAKDSDRQKYTIIIEE
ncbi:Ig domain-containing protein [Lutimonas halocynthiae]|uniref:Ig domain-containing protein n=1 Tax=Lutimonas halocynthiae TaxID=1446477 RepID=UPI0025B52B03|nr:Ig domain-containing protein [Lutimonas halocynthiae]MDN3643938.1 Ig domain-containing protein [Lutimonas halocynthiae]